MILFTSESCIFLSSDKVYFIYERESGVSAVLFTVVNANARTTFVESGGGLTVAFFLKGVFTWSTFRCIIRCELLAFTSCVVVLIGLF